jgi:hypothetical protein
VHNFITLGQPLPGEKYVAEKKKKRKEEKQAGAELCQAQVKLVSQPASPSIKNKFEVLFHL